MSRRTSRSTSFTSGVNPVGPFRAKVVGVSGGLASIQIPRLGLNNVYEDVPYSGFVPSAGTDVWAFFIEGDASRPMIIVSAEDSQSDINEIVAGTNLNGGGTGGSITLNLDDDITLSTVTADGFYGDLYGAIHILVKNVSGGSLTKGTPVYATGAVGASGAVEVEASLAGTGSTMPAMGLLDQDLANNGEGDVVVSGVLQNIDTDTPGYSVGDELFVAASGGLTTTRPTGSSELVQKIGKVIRVQQQTGEILVQGAGRTNDVPNVVAAGGLAIDTDTLYVDATNDRVGIGTTSPAAPLHVSGDVTVEDATPVLTLKDTNTTGGSNFQIKFTDDADTTLSRIYGGAGNDMRFEVGGNDVLFLRDNGNVGIGTTSPAEELHVLKDQDGVLTQMMIENIDQRLRIGAYYEAGVNQYSKIQSEADNGSDQRLALNPEGGNVGIGTTSPSYELEVDGTVTATALAVTGEFTLPTADGTADQVLVTDGSGSVTWQDSGATTPGGSDGLVQYNNGGAFGGASSLYYDDVNNRVGINDSTPSYTLDVNGTGRFTGALDADTQINLGSALHLTQADVDGSMRVQGNSGYIDIGPKSTSFCNIDTDRGSFYFNKNTLYANGYQIWHAGNDGSGSGLDADTVDGVHASSFLRSDTTDSASGTLSFSTASATNFTSTNLTVGASLNTGRRFYVYGGTLASELRRESTSSSSGIAIFTGTGGTSKFIFYADGTGGKATGDAAWIVVSDDRLKNKLTSLDSDDTLTRLMALDPTMYEHTHTINLVSDGIGEDDLEVVDLDVPAAPLAGFMASDFETQFPDLVLTKGTQNIRHLPIGQWDAILTAGLQASVRRIEALEERIAALEAQ